IARDRRVGGLRPGRQIVALEDREHVRPAAGVELAAETIHRTREQRANGLAAKEPIEVTPIRGRNLDQLALGAGKVERQSGCTAAALLRGLGFLQVLDEAIETHAQKRAEARLRGIVLLD